MLEDDTKVIDYMRVGHRVTEFDLESLRRIKAFVEAQNTDVQQLKPKMPLLADVLNHVNSLSVVGNCNVISRQVGADIAYNFISRHFEH
jgi:hypothetical protein